MAAVMPMDRRTFGSDLEQVSLARHWLNDLIGPDHPAAFTAELLGCELATNALKHTFSGLPGGRFEMRIDQRDDSVWIGVVDEGGPSEPAVRADVVEDEAESGRGLMMLEEIATKWGTEPLERGCRLVWCTIPAIPDL